MRIWPCQSPPWAHSTMSVSGFATRRPNMCLYMTYLTKILWFCRLPPYLKVWRFLEDSLPFRCCYRLELTLVFEARDLNSVIQQTIRSGIWRNLRRRKLHLAKTASYNRSSESPSLSFGRNHFGNSATNWNTVSCYKERFQTPGDG